MKVEIEFDEDPQTKEPVPSFLGRLVLGNYPGRLYLKPNGKTVLFIEKQAIEDGSIVLLKDFGEAVGFK